MRVWAAAIVPTARIATASRAAVCGGESRRAARVCSCARSRLEARRMAGRYEGGGGPPV
jgi:hypothetical protein